MDKVLLYPLGTSESCRYAAGLLKKYGCRLIDHPSPEITHVLLDIPSFDPTGCLRDGSDLNRLLPMLPKAVTVIGGNLNTIVLKDYQRMDLLQDPVYLAKNAVITAECALQAAAPYIKSTFRDTDVLILGWGRIGKNLANLLSSLGCHTAVAARKESDRAMLEALGYEAVDFSLIPQILHRYKLLFNTVPSLPVEISVTQLPQDGVAIDLASYPGISGDFVITARGLPGKYAPESSGKLIAETVLRIYKEDIQ